jgi:hypothetical protein
MTKDLLLATYTKNSEILTHLRFVGQRGEMLSLALAASTTDDTRHTDALPTAHGFQEFCG